MLILSGTSREPLPGTAAVLAGSKRRGKGRAEHPVFFLPAAISGWAWLEGRQSPVEPLGQGRASCTAGAVTAWIPCSRCRAVWAEEDVCCPATGKFQDGLGTATRIYPLKPSQKHCRGLLSNQQQIPKFMIQKNTPGAVV